MGYETDRGEDSRTDGDQLFVNPSSMLLAFLLPAFLLGFRVPAPVRTPSAACAA